MCSVIPSLIILAPNEEVHIFFFFFGRLNWGFQNHFLLLLLIFVRLVQNVFLDFLCLLPNVTACFFFFSSSELFKQQAGSGCCRVFTPICDSTQHLSLEGWSEEAGSLSHSQAVIASMMPADLLFNRPCSSPGSNCQVQDQRCVECVTFTHTPPSHCNIGRFPLLPLHPRCVFIQTTGTAQRWWTAEASLF